MTAHQMGGSPLKKFIAVALLAVATAVGTAAAKPANQHPQNSHKCVAHSVAYSARGTLVSGSLTNNGKNTYSGDLTVHVTHTNSHARADNGTDKSYTLDHAKVKLGHGENAAALTPNSRVKLNGKITVLPKKCDQTGFTPTTTIRKASIKQPKAP
jgi:hypothetical protein